MSAAIAALASYGGSDSESDSGSDAEGGPGLSAQVAGADAVLHLAAPPPSVQQVLLPVVDSAPAVSVKVRAGRRRPKSPPKRSEPFGYEPRRLQ